MVRLQFYLRYTNKNERYPCYSLVALSQYNGCLTYTPTNLFILSARGEKITIRLPDGGTKKKTLKACRPNTNVHHSSKLHHRRLSNKKINTIKQLNCQPHNCAGK